MTKDALAGVTATLGNLGAWFAQSEQLWFPMVGSYMTHLQPVYDLPDLRGPFAFLTLIYIGLRLGDLWDKREEITDL